MLISPYTAQTSKTKVSVTTTAAALPSTAANVIYLTAPAANTGPVIIGDSTVTSTAGGNVFTEIPQGTRLELRLADASKLYAVAAAAQTLYVGALR